MKSRKFFGDFGGKGFTEGESGDTRSVGRLDDRERES
jgi:hypothetical protein